MVAKRCGCMGVYELRMTKQVFLCRGSVATMESPALLLRRCLGTILNADQAMAKASELCQKKGGTNIKVLLSRNSDPVSGMLFCSIAASGHGPSAIVGAGYGTIPPAADGAAFVDCRQKGVTSPHIVVGWKERALDGMVPNTRAGKF